MTVPRIADLGAFDDGVLTGPLGIAEVADAVRANFVLARELGWEVTAAGRSDRYDLGVADPRLAQDVAEFQRDRPHLRTNGQVNPQTLDALQTARVVWQAAGRPDTALGRLVGRWLDLPARRQRGIDLPFEAAPSAQSGQSGSWWPWLAAGAAAIGAAVTAAVVATRNKKRKRQTAQ